MIFFNRFIFSLVSINVGTYQDKFVMLFDMTMSTIKKVIILALLFQNFQIKKIYLFKKK